MGTKLSLRNIITLGFEKFFCAAKCVSHGLGELNLQFSNEAVRLPLMEQRDVGCCEPFETGKQESKQASNS